MPTADRAMRLGTPAEIRSTTTTPDLVRALTA